MEAQSGRNCERRKTLADVRAALKGRCLPSPALHLKKAIGAHVTRKFKRTCP